MSFFDESHHIMRQTMKKFVEKEISPFVEEWEENEEFPIELYQKAGQHGFLGIGFDPEFGGVESDFFHYLVAVEELTRSGSQGVVAGLFSHAIGLPPVQALGSKELKAKVMPEVLSGKKIIALGITEPNAGSDVANIQTKAVRDGEHYIVNGSKTFITSGVRADYLTAAVRTGGAGFGGVSLLLIESNTPGYKVEKKLKKMGWWASDTAEISFTDCRVPVANLLGKENDGFTGIMLNFQNERLFLAAMAYSTAEVALALSIEHARNREAFGKSLMSKQVIRHKLASMATKIEVTKSYVYNIASRVVAGDTMIKEVAMAKNAAVEACDYVVNEAVQIHGGMGYMRECAVERLYRDARILGIGGGTNEIMTEIITKTMGLD